MTTLQLVHGETGRTSPSVQLECDCFSEEARDAEECTVHEFPSQTDLLARHDAPRFSSKGVGFFRNLSTKSIHDFESLARHFCCPGTTVLFREEEVPSSIILLTGGRVKLSMNSGDGRRLIVRIAEPGEILGLASAVSGSAYDITAEAQFPCVFSSIDRAGFLDYLVRYPTACLNVARQLSLDDKRTFEQLRTLGLTLTAHAKLARLLLDWCLEGEPTERGTRVQCWFTHGEIGEHIGASRETVGAALGRARCFAGMKFPEDFRRQSYSRQLRQIRQRSKNRSREEFYERPKFVGIT